MKGNARSALRISLLTWAAAVLTACAGESSVGPSSATDLEIDLKTQDLGVCENIEAPEGTKLVRLLYAKGAQIYSWSGTTWTFVAPDARLFESPRGRGVVGTHYAGPTWESRSGSTSVGAVVDRCTPNPNAIPWLLLSTVSQGPGMFNGVTYIQRLRTEGGSAPSEPGSVVGQEARVPYTAIYALHAPK